MFDDMTHSMPEMRWHELTDRYAAAVAAFQRGDAAAREQLRMAYEELRHLTRSEGLPFPGAAAARRD